MSAAARAPSEWVLATTNQGKLAEYRALFAGLPIRLRALSAAADSIPAETGSTFVENALIKARYAAGVSGTAAIADDSGLCVDRLGYAPGVHSARYAGESATDVQNIERLLRALDGVPDENRTATFVCVIVAIRSAEDPLPIIATGRWPGRIAGAPSGTNGFGYDPVFFDPLLAQTAACLPPPVKNSVSHRARACAELKRQLGF